MIRRRAILIACVILTGLLIAAMTEKTVSPKYLATEVLRIAPPKVARDLVAGSVSARMVTRLPELRQFLLRSESLAEIAQVYELYPPTKALAPLAAAEKLRRSVDIAWVSPAPGQTLVTISAEMTNAEQARQVAQELAHRMINRAAMIRIDDARATLDLLRQAEHRVAEKLVGLEHEAALMRAANGLAGAAGDLSRRAELAELPAEAIAELRAHESELDHTRGELTTLSTRRARAEMVLDLETRRQAERLVVVEPAERSETPSSDPRVALATAGGALTALVALGLALLLEWRHPVIRTAAQMRRLTGIDPIAIIPRSVRKHPRKRLHKVETA